MSNTDMPTPVRTRKGAIVRSTLATLLIGWTTLSSAQSDLHVLVQDSATAEALPGASAVVVGLSLSATADMDGKLVLRGIPDGAHVLRVAGIGFHAREQRITLPFSGAQLVVKLAATSEELEEAVVSATRTGSRIDDAPQKIEVLGAEELLEEGSLKPGNMASMIGDISSVQVQQISAVSGASQVRMQGLQGRHTLLMRDGLPAYGGLSGGFDILRLPPLDLQQVEVLKGPSSTFHGGGAIAGAIDFITKTPLDSINGLVMVNGSTLGEFNTNAYVNGPLSKKTGFTLFAGITDQQPRDVDGDGWTDVSKQRQTQVHPQVFLKPWNKGTIRLGMLAQSEQRTGGNLSTLDVLDDTTHYTERINSQRLAGDLIAQQQFSEGRSLTVKGSAGRYWQDAKSTLLPTAPELRQDNVYGEAFWKAHTDRNTLVLGANYWGMRLSSTMDSTIQDLSTVGAFGQYALHRERWPSIELGLRVDHNATFGTFTLPSIAALFKPTDRLTLRANAGTGYQLPDRTQPYGLVAEQETRPDLAPGTVAERSTGGTAEWTYRTVLNEKTSVFFDQTFFLTRIDDPLAVTNNADGTSTLGNAPGHTLTRGIDNYIRITHGATELYLGYTWTLPQNVSGSTRTQVSYTPVHRLAATLGRQLNDHWRVGLEASYNGPQQRYDASNTHDQWFVVSMVGYRAGRWNFVVNCENGLDVRQTRWERTVYGTASRPTFIPLWAPIDGRAINLSAMWRF
ncbi:MAG: TonB-dependent receptor [Flavobacteriales bacterium]|nr:TonB-dependent receptor [Flavobacteriales bacterium]